MQCHRRRNRQKTQGVQNEGDDKLSMHPCAGALQSSGIEQRLHRLYPMFLSRKKCVRKRDNTKNKGRVVSAEREVQMFRSGRFCALKIDRCRRCSFLGVLFFFYVSPNFCTRAHDIRSTTNPSAARPFPSRNVTERLLICLQSSA